MSSYSVHSSVLYAAHFLLSSQLFHTPSLITYRKLLLIYASQGSTENTFFTVRSVLDNAISYGLISGVYGTASRGLLLLMYFQQRGFYWLLHVASGHLCTVDLHKGRGHIKMYTSAHTSASLNHFRKTYNDICNWKWSYSVLFNLEIVYTEGLICGFSLFSVCAYVLPYIHVFSLYILDGVSQQSGPSWLCLDCHVMCCAGLWCVQAERPTKRHTDRHTDR